jgi:short subunit dehydrogenase-like uncharacterized protein
MSFLLYGANGYTGALIADVAHREGERAILAGRRAEAIAPLAERYGFEHRVFTIDSPAQIARSLNGVSAVLLAAGPFSTTSAAMLEACMMAGVHYLDITGEIAVFEHCFAQHARAAAAGVVILPGVGFDVVPSDCLAAALAAELPGAHSLELAFTSSGGRGSLISRGTAKTMVEGFGEGGAIRQNGRIQRVPPGWRARRVPFRHGERDVISIPWGDVATAYHSTGIPNVIVYTGLSRWQRRALRLSGVLAPVVRIAPVRRFIVQQIERRITGPDEEARRTVNAQLWGRVVHADGRSVEGTLVTPEAYQLTAETAFESARRVAAGLLEPGYSTPSLAFGARYITEFAGCDMRVESVTR